MARKTEAKGTRPLRVGVVGYGYWGPNLVRNFLQNPASECVMVADLSEGRLARVSDLYPTVRTTTSADELIASDDVDAVAVSTPVDTHYTLAKKALGAGKHVWVEKPMTHQVALGEELCRLAAKHGVLLHVDHTFIYTGAVRKIKELMDAGELGDIYYVDSVRINLGLFQHDVNVVWDLAPHDLSIVDHVLGRQAISVSSVGACHAGGGLEDVAYLNLDYGRNLIANFHVNWLSPVKVRRMIFGGTKRMVIFDDMNPAEKIRVYDKGIDLEAANRDGIHRLLVQYRSGDMWAPAIDASEALGAEVSHFVECAVAGRHTMTDGEAGLRVVQILEASQMSIKSGGKRVAL